MKKKVSKKTITLDLEKIDCDSKRFEQVENELSFALKHSARQWEEIVSLESKYFWLSLCFLLCSVSVIVAHVMIWNHLYA